MTTISFLHVSVSSDNFNSSNVALPKQVICFYRSGQLCRANHTFWDELITKEWHNSQLQILRISHLSFYFTSPVAMAKEPNLIYHLTHSRREKRMDSCLSRGLARNDMQTTLSRIWTWLAQSTFFNDNHYYTAIL